MIECQRSRSTKSSRFARKLAAYAAAATSLTGAEGSAAIVYRDFGLNGLAASNSTLNLDLDLDGNVDFVLSDRHAFDRRTTGTYPYSIVESSGYTLAQVQGRNANRLVSNVDPGQYFCCARHEAGDIISSLSPNFQSATLFRSFFNHSTETSTALQVGGDFGTERGFLGVAFIAPVAPAEVRAGWIDIEIGNGIQIYRYAYETEPGVPIVAGAVPEPPSLVLLATGAAGLAALRRKRQTARFE